MAPGLQFPWNCQIKVKDLGYFCRLVPTIEVRSRLTMVVWCPIRPSQPSLCVRFCEPISVVLDHISSRTSVYSCQTQVWPLKESSKLSGRGDNRSYVAVLSFTA